MRIEVTSDGPYAVTGSVPMARQSIGADAGGQSMGWNQGEDYPAAESYELCRCGRSANKPYCDGSHERVRFDGTETASRRPYQRQAEEHAGPELPPSIGIVEDPVVGVGGPIWVRGGIPVTSAEGHDYEVRNRVALCRCGSSRNKPFCDGSHVTIRFTGT